MKPRHDEFSLSIGWRRQNVEVPGFYLQAGWSNEGEAQWIVEKMPLSFNQLERIYAMINEECDLRVPAAISTMRAEYVRDTNERIKRLQDQKIRIDQQLTILLRSEKNSLDN